MTELIKLKNDCRVHIEKQNIISAVSKIIREIPSLEKIKNDIDFLRFVISTIADMIHPKVKEKLKPEDLAYEIYCDLFPSSSVDVRELVKKNLDYIVNNNQIDKVSFVKKNKKRFWDIFKRK